MQISGHKTRSVFERYHILDQSDMRAAVMKLERAADERRAQEMQSEMFREEPQKKPMGASGAEGEKQSKIQ